MDTATAEYRLRILDPQGNEKRVLTLDGSSGHPLLLSGGVRNMEVRPNGDCREATFEGDPKSLGIAPRDTVQVQWRVDNGATWKNRYAGTVVISGSNETYDTGRYKLQGFALRRLTEVEVRGALPQADLGGQIRQLFADVIESGQLGSSLGQPSIDTVGDLNVTSAPLIPNYRHVTELIDNYLKGRSQRIASYLNADGSVQNRTVNPDWGVNADLVPVFGYPGGVLELDEGQDDVTVDGLDLDSTHLVTDVRLMLTRTLRALRGLAVIEGDNGQSSFVAADFQNSGLLTYPVQVADRHFGQAWRNLPLDTNTGYFRPKYAYAVQAHYDYQDLGTGSMVTQAAAITGDVATLEGTGRVSVAPPAAPPARMSELLYTVQLTFSAADFPAAYSVLCSNGSLQSLTHATGTLLSQTHIVLSRPSSSVAPLYVLPEFMYGRMSAAWPQKDTTLYLQFTPADPTKPITLQLGNLWTFDSNAVGAIAAPLGRLPWTDPATVRVEGWGVESAAVLRLTRRDVAGGSLGRRELPIDLLVYDIEEDGTMYTEIRCGQTDDAEALSFAATIATKDQNATNNAVLATI